VVNEDDCVNQEERDLDPKLQKWRLKERKGEFVEMIQQVAMKEVLPKAIITSKLKLLEECTPILGEKEGDKQVEDKLGLKLTQKYQTAPYYEDHTSSPEPHKNYFEKKKERDQHEGKA